MAAAISGLCSLHYCTVNSRVEWFTTFFDFRKWTHGCRSCIFLWVQFQKIGKFCRTRVIVFSSKNHVGLKNEYLFWKICKYFPLRVHQWTPAQIRKFEKKINHFILDPKMANMFFIVSLHYLLLNKLRKTICFRCNF